MVLTEPILIFMLGQSIVIVAAVGLAYMRTQILIAEVKIEIKSMSSTVQTMKTDHKAMQSKVDGISRHVAVIEGMELEKQRQQQQGPTLAERSGG